MKIQSTHLHIYRNEEHFQFMRGMLALLHVANAETREPVSDICETLVQLVEREDHALEQIRKHGLTDPIAETDTRRDSIYRGIVLIVKGYHYSADTNEAAMAARIQIIVDHYGNFTRKSYNEETAIINNLLQDLDERCSNELQQLHLQSWVTNLAEANNHFIQLMDERFDDHATHDNPDVVSDLRRKVDAAYTQLTAKINALVVIHDKAAYADFINKLNERITYYNNVLAIRCGRNTKKRSNAIIKVVKP